MKIIKKEFHFAESALTSIKTTSWGCAQCGKPLEHKGSRLIHPTHEFYMLWSRVIHCENAGKVVQNPDVDVVELVDIT